MLCFIVITCFQATRTKSGTYWLLITNILLIGSIVVLPLTNVVLIEHESKLFFTILVLAVKEGSFLLWSSTWSSLMSKLFSSNILGRVYSLSYFTAHLLLVIGSIVYPRLMTFVTTNKFLQTAMGKTRFALFFGFLTLPLLITLGLIIRMRLLFKKVDDLII
jgi:hypothetical protein